MRQLHHCAALVFVAATGVHLLRVLLTGAFRRLHRALTDGDLCEEMEHLDDDTAIRIGAVTTAVLPDIECEALLQTVADGGVARRAPGGGVALALVLLIGLNSVHHSDREAI